MKYTKLGKSGLTVSRICMGCMGFGNASAGQDRECGKGVSDDFDSGKNNRA